MANEGNNTVSVFALRAAPPPPATLSGLITPFALAVDAQGNVFVLNGNGTVSVFAPGSTTPTRTLTGLSNPGALAFDAQGNLYVANEGNNTVSVFAPGSTTPTATLTGLSGPDALAFRRPGQPLRGQRHWPAR